MPIFADANDQAAGLSVHSNGYHNVVSYDVKDISTNFKLLAADGLLNWTGHCNSICKNYKFVVKW